MNRFARSIAALLVSASPTLAPAQTAALPTLQPSDARDPVETLGRYLRILSTSPRDLEALTGAGRAALDVGDANAAIGFYARAEEIAPRDGRIKAGLGSALVQMEQPKQALKLFGQAVDLGVPVASIAADRGLAYDLTGENRRAQADYATALKAQPSDETTRRLALSQAMSGDRATAMATLDPLLRKQDRGAWRASTFVLALTGDDKAAVERLGRLVSPQQASGLAPFLAKVASLKPAQQAQAVHFGHLPAGRGAGTALASSDSPALSSGGVARGAPTRLAGVGQADGRVSHRDPVADQVTPRPGPAMAAPTLATAPSPRMPANSATLSQAGAVPTQPAGSQALNGQQPSTTTAAASVPSSRPVETSPSASSGATPPMSTAAPVALAEAIPPGQVDPRFTEPAPARASLSAIDLPPSQAAKAAVPAPAPGPLTPAEAPPVRTASVASAKAGRAGVTRPVVVEEPAATTTARRRAMTTADTATTAKSRATTGSKNADKPETTKRGAKTDARLAVPGKGDKDRREADAARADKAKRAADTAKADKARLAASSKKEPQRYWVQVATGAYKADLPKSWANVKARYPQLMAGKSAWTTPLRFTNRVLVGPFKSSDDAQAFVNTAGKAGFGTSPFTSTSGQGVERLPSK